ncbi:ead/Ea22-like family protein [Escherichia coli]|uniref:ead/Ea22-like family protein n=1 Tax=Escherichia coli TaxID=562 RepID=UPI00225B9DE7|nr:ead/Ea22-like family protein [Escherichia coli]
MSKIDYQALRETADAANKASWGRWESYHPHEGERGHEVKVGVKAIAQLCLKVDAEFIAASNPATVLALLDELEAAEKRIAELEANKCKPVMFIDGDISPADADKLAAVIREFNEETETPAARMARIIRENPHPTNMCDMPAAGIGVKGE